MENTAEKKRLFVAIALPDAVRDKLSDLQKGLPGIRWTKPDTIHLTLRFIGEVPLDHADRIREALEKIRADQFSLRVRGLGFFLRKSRGVLWAGLDASPALLALKQEVDKLLLLHAGLTPETGRFSPHLTLGRMKNADRKALSDFTSRYSEKLKADFPVHDFFLYSSLLMPSGAVHTAEAQYLLLP